MLARLSNLFIILIFMVVSGCVAYNKGNLPAVRSEDLRVKSGEKVRLFVFWNSALSISRGLETFSPEYMMNENGKEYLSNLFLSTGCCYLMSNKEAADLIVEIKIYPPRESSVLGTFWAALSGASLAIIPSFYTEETHLAARVTKGHYIKYYDLQDSSKTINWVPLIFVMPFTGNASKVHSKVEENVYKNLVLKIENDGFLTRY